MRLLYSIAVFAAVAGVALADVFLKRATTVEQGFAVARSPWLWVGVVLYLFQIAVFAYLLENGVLLSYVGALQTVIYAVVVLGASFLVFGERITATQGIGMSLALSGVILMNLPK